MSWTGEITHEQARQFVAEPTTAEALSRVTGVPLAEVQAHLGTGGVAPEGPQSRGVARVGGGRVPSTGRSSPSADQQQEEERLYRAYVDLSGGGDAPSLPPEGELPVETIAGLKARAAWVPGSDEEWEHWRSWL